MTQKSDKLMGKLIQFAEWAVDNETPMKEKLSIVPKIHETTLSLKQELPNMSNAEKVDIATQLILLESIVILEKDKAIREMEFGVD